MFLLGELVISNGNLPLIILLYEVRILRVKSHHNKTPPNQKEEFHRSCPSVVSLIATSN